MSLQHSTTQSNNGKNNSNMERKYYYSFIFIPFLIKSSPIPAIRQRHYKTKRKEKGRKKLHYKIRKEHNQNKY